MKQNNEMADLQKTVANVMSRQEVTTFISTVKNEFDNKMDRFRAIVFDNIAEKLDTKVDREKHSNDLKLKVGKNELEDLKTKLLECRKDLVMMQTEMNLKLKLIMDDEEGDEAYDINGRRIQ